MTKADLYQTQGEFFCRFCTGWVHDAVIKISEKIEAHFFRKGRPCPSKLPLGVAGGGGARWKCAMGVWIASVGLVPFGVLNQSLERDVPAFTRVIRWRPLGLSPQC